MKRFITYLYTYKDGEKLKNTGHIRVDIRNSSLNMQISMKDMELENQKATFYIIEKNEGVYGHSLEEILIHNGQYNGNISCPFFENIVGVGLSFENGVYMASCWKDGEEDTISNRMLWERDVNANAQMQAASIPEEEQPVLELSITERDLEYCKINLNEIYGLPNRFWHYSNNSFLIHGFWNYGYLVLKESMEENQKRISLGVPGIYEPPEMVMAAYFGFPIFETLPSQMEEMEVGQRCSWLEEEKNQKPKDGTFGCWFVTL